MKNGSGKSDASGITNDWVIGFVEGEGSFTRDRQKKKYLYPSFLIVNSDFGILKEIQRFFGFGDIKKHGDVNNKHANVRGRKQIWQYRVSGFKRCTVLRDFFRGRLKTESKRRQFAEWEKLWGAQKR